MKRISLSIVIPALNEEETIGNAIHVVVKTCELSNAEYEIFVYDDGSVDNTGQIAMEYAKRNKKIIVIRNKVTQGLGRIFTQFLRRASKDYWIYFPGDADMAGWSLAELIRQAGQADLIITYPRNASVRKFHRQLFSRLVTFSLNAILGKKIRYFTGSFICRLKLVKNLHLDSRGFGALFEFKARLIKSGATYMEIPCDHVGRMNGRSKAFTVFNIVDTIRTVLLLARDRFQAAPQR